MKVSCALLSVSMFCLALPGCKSVSPDAGFADVRAAALARLGKDIHWNNGSSEDQAVAQTLHSMLEKELTFDEAIQIALLNNRRLQSEYATLGIAQADLVQAGLLKNPGFSGNILPPVGGGGPALVGLDLAKDFLDVLFMPKRKRAAAAQFEATKARVTAAVLRVAADTQFAFYELQAAQQLQEFWQATVKATEATLMTTEKMHQAGNGTKLDVGLERAQHNQAKLGLAQAETAAVQTRERLTSLMGLWGKAASSWKVAPRLPEIPVEELPTQEIEKRVIEQNLNLAASRHELEALAQQRGVTKLASILPTLEAGVTAEREDDGKWFVGPSLGLEIPIFDQGQAKRAKARAEIRRAMEAHAALAVELRSTARATVHRLTQARARALFLRDEMLPLRQENLSQTQLQYNAMQIGVFALLQSKRDQIETARQYIETLRDYWKARAAVEHLQAGLSQSEPMSGILNDKSE